MQNLVQALQIGSGSELIAFIGGGGKSSLMFALAHQLPGRILIATTTRMFAAQIEDAAQSLDAHIITYSGAANLGDSWKDRTILVGPLQADKVTGVPPNLPQQLLADGLFDYALVEADGAKMLPIKAPAAHEPALPVAVTLVVPVAGIDALHGRIDQVAHRPQIVARLLGKEEAAEFTAADIATLLTHEEGGLKDLPYSARAIPTINKVDTPAELAAARQIARQMLRHARIQHVLLSSHKATDSVVEAQKRVTAVVLAAGESRRMGQSKQLLPWGATTILGQTLRNLKESSVFDVVVVVGAEAEQVAAEAHQEDVPTIHNAQYAAREMLSSLQIAVRQLPQNRSAVLVVLADQPRVSAEVIDQLLHAYAQGRGTIVAPAFDGRRGNPVLIDRLHFPELLALPPGSAPRHLLQRHAVHQVPVPTSDVLQDIDTVDDYHHLRPR
jgi:molybdenum cofactor cytidylyltransferase